VQAVGEEPPQVAAGHEFDADTNDLAALQAALYRLVERAGDALRRQRRAARSVAVIVDYSDGTRRARQSATRPATANDISLFEAACRALDAAGSRRVRVRHLRLVCNRLVFPPAQLALFDDEQRTVDKRARVIGALDAVRHRFGRDALQVGRTLAA
jgi:DNA polymerase-4